LVDLTHSEHAKRVIMFSVKKPVDIVGGVLWCSYGFFWQSSSFFAIQTLDGRLAARSTLRLETPDPDNIA